MDPRLGSLIVASELARLSDTVDARVIVLGGDVRAKHLIRDHLPSGLGSRVHLIDQGRATDGSEEVRRREVRRLVTTAVAEDTASSSTSSRRRRVSY